MSKYIIELDDRIKIVTSVGVTENGVVYTTSDYVHNLEELNSDYINEHYGELQDEAYRKGYDDGKDSFSKGCKGCRYTSKKSHEEPCFSCTRNHMDQYEPMPQEDDRIEVGDEVIWKTDNIKLIVTSMYKVGSINWCDGVAQDGKVYSTLIENNQKTGKHYDIASILEAMRTHD